jgi:two-component system chemotaxis response regulator CheB
MPSSFMQHVATQAEQSAGRACAIARDGEQVSSAGIYLAPGDGHLRLKKSNEQIVVQIDRGERINHCRPAVDPMFKSLAEMFGSGVLAVVLTGMGRDGLAGANRIAAAGGCVAAQDSGSSVVWGMPGAVARAGLCSAVGTPEEIARWIVRISTDGDKS